MTMTTTLRRTRALLGAGAALAALTAPALAQDDPRAALLVDAAWLQSHLNDPDLVVLHVGRAYADGHVPGAANLDVGALSYSAGEMDDPDHVMLDLPPDLGTARAAFEAAGVSDGSTVVFVYENRGLPMATRALWTLQVLGKDDARILDGGLQAWTESGGEVSTAPAAPGAGSLTTAPRLDRRVDKVFVRDRGTSPGIALIDARRPAHYDGVEEEIEGRAGHIPGAGSLWVGEITGEDGRLKPAAELRSLFEAAGYEDGDQVVTYCHIGLWGSAVLFAARTLGYDAVLYDGSMTEWSRDRSLPLEPAGGGR